LNNVCKINLGFVAQTTTGNVSFEKHSHCAGFDTPVFFDGGTKAGKNDL